MQPIIDYLTLQGPALAVAVCCIALYVHFAVRGCASGWKVPPAAVCVGSVAAVVCTPPVLAVGSVWVYGVGMGAVGAWVAYMMLVVSGRGQLGAGVVPAGVLYSLLALYAPAARWELLVALGAAALVALLVNLLVSYDSSLCVLATSLVIASLAGSPLWLLVPLLTLAVAGRRASIRGVSFVFVATSALGLAAAPAFGG